ncbi:hypothetical protein niasHT_010609 [Heterodera trifolii]|uniref:Uncharacterized protein n=1 Tax=Heterodera trifolii TaxID=157864 RepID=A0ABD2L8Z4_9BILA
MASRARKWEFEGDNLDFSSLREENGLTKDEFRKEILLYLCYGGNEAAMLVTNLLPARVMASKGLHPQVRSDDKEI